MVDVKSTMKGRAVLLAWIVGLVFIAGLVWSLTFQFRANSLMRVTNRVLLVQGDHRRLYAPLSRQFTGSGPLGNWYSIANSDSFFFVFAILRDGILVPCGVELSSRGEITGLIPLGNHARRVINRIPQGVLEVYIHRIESVAKRGLAAR